MSRSTSGSWNDTPELKPQRNSMLGPLWFFTGRVASAVTSFLVVLLAARWLGPEDFGVLLMLFAGGALANLVVNAGSDQMLVRAVAAGDTMAIGRVLGLQATLAGVLFIGLSGATAAALLVGWPSRIAVALIIVGGQLLVGAWSTVMLAALQGYERFRSIALAMTVAGLVTVVSALGLGRSGLPAFVFAQFVGQVVGALLAARSVRERCGRIRPEVRWETFRTARAFGVMVIASAAAAQLPLILIGSLSGSPAAGVHGTAQRLHQMQRMPPAAIFSAWLPRLSRGEKPPTGVRALSYVFAAGSAFVLWVLARQIDEVLLSGQSDPWAIRWFSVMILPLVARLDWSTTLIARGEEATLARWAGAHAAIVIGGVAVLAAVGASAASLAAFVMLALVGHAIVLWAVSSRR